MVGAAYAAVPFYNWFCRATGFAGTTQVATAAPDGSARPQDHGAVRRQCRPRPAVAVRARAERDRGPASARSSPSTTWSINEAARADRRRRRPTTSRRRRSGPISHKINCFCFTEQTLEPGEKRDMAVVFYVDPAMARTPTQDDLNTITLSYTFYPVRRAEPAGGGKCGGAERNGRTLNQGSGRRRRDERRTETTTMADAHAKHHDYHLVDPSPWPAVGSHLGLRAWRSARSPGCTTCSPAAPFVFGARRDRRALHHVRLVERRHERGRATRATTPAWCRSPTATA